MTNRSLMSLTIVLILGLSACNGAKDNSTLLAEAKSQFEHKDMSSAVINLKNIIKNQPNNAQARFLLGKIYLFNDNYLSAEKELKKALSIDSDNASISLYLAQTQLSLNRFTDTLETLSNKSFNDQDETIRALFISAKAQLSLNKLNLAEENVTLANQLDGNNKFSVLGKALIAAYNNHTEQALSLINPLVSDYKEFTDAWLLKGSIHSNAEQYEQAANAYLLYFKLKPQNFAIQTLIAHNFIKAGLFEAAKPYVDALRKINDNHPTINLLAAQVAYSEQDYIHAKELANTVANNTDNGLAQMISGLSSFQLGEDEQAYYQLNAIADSLPKNHKVNKILAILQVKLGYQDELNNNLALLADDDAQLYANLGIEFVNQGDKIAAKEMFNKAVSITPTDATIKTQLGIVKLSSNDNSGVDELKDALTIDPNFSTANIALAMNYLKNNQIDEAEKIANQWLSNQPNSITALILSGNIAAKSNKPNKAKTFFNKALEINADNIIPLFNLAVIAAENKEFDHSNELLDKLFAIDLEYPYAYRLAISNAIATDQEKTLENKIIQQISNSPSAVWPRIILARRYSLQHNNKDAIKLLEQITDYTQLPKIYFLTYLNLLKADHQDEKVDNVYRNWQKAQPNNEFAYLSQIKYFEKNNEYQKALNLTNQVLSSVRFKSNIQFQSLQAYFLLATSQFELAEKKINRLSALEPNHAFVLRLQGQLAMARSDFKEAINFLLKSYQLSPKEDVALYIATSYKKMGNIDAATNFMEKQLTKNPNNIIYNTFLAELYISSSPDKAIIKYQKLLSENPSNIINLNNLAWLYYEKNDYIQAQNYSKKAVELAPNNPDILDTYGLILTSLNKIKEAITVLTKANELKPHNTEIITHLSEAYKANKQPELAEKLLKSL